jgi:hypothetical protein
MRKTITWALLGLQWLFLLTTIFTIGYGINIIRAVISPPYGLAGLIDVHREQSLHFGREPSFWDYAAIPLTIVACYAAVFLLRWIRCSLVKNGETCVAKLGREKGCQV